MSDVARNGIMKQNVEEIFRSVALPLLCGGFFLLWIYGLIGSSSPAALFPLSGLLIPVLYFFSGPIYAAVLLFLLTVTGFIGIYLSGSLLTRLAFFLESAWFWAFFLALRRYTGALNRQRNMVREEGEIIESNTVLFESRLRQNESRIAALSQRLTNYQSLGNVVNALCSSLQEEKIVQLMRTSAQQLIGKGAWRAKRGGRHDLFAQYIHTSGLPAIVDDLNADNRFYVRRPKFLSLIGVPLEVDGKCWGVLKGVGREPKTFDANDLRFLSVLGGIGSIALGNARLYRRTQELAITDGLTGLYVHHYFKERLAEELRRSRNHRLPLSVALFDVDHFKDFNDTYGHAAGDVILRQIASLLRRRLRETDLIGRYGGEEFSVIMMQTDIREAHKVIEEIRKWVKKERFFLPVESFQPVYARLTVSVGIAALSAETPGEHELLSRADAALYRAKKLGRNRVEVN